MTLKFLLVALSIFGSFFINTNLIKAQETTNCCQFNTKDPTTGEEFRYCLNTTATGCTAGALKVNVTNVFEPSISYAGGSCLNDDNTPANGDITSPGTHCTETNASTNNPETTICDSDNLSDCIAARMPNKNGTAGTAKSSLGLVSSIASVINTVLGLLGLLFTVMLVYAGIQWIHYGGESDGKKKAIKRIRNAVIGLAITLSAYSITAFVINNL